MIAINLVVADLEDAQFTQHVRQALVLRRLVGYSGHGQDGYDFARGVVHFLAFLEGRTDEAVGTIRLCMLGHSIVLLQHLCVHPSYRRRSIGTALVSRFDRYAFDGAKLQSKADVPVPLIRFFEEQAYRKDGSLRTQDLVQIQPMSKMLRD
ncbi:MAG: GNAT family N-acetyltransferase [Patescibacteria group bacterium]